MTMTAVVPLGFDLYVNLRSNAARCSAYFMHVLCYLLLVVGHTKLKR